MKRRSNKSHKVPNVKLRPAQSNYLNLNGPITQCWAEDSQADSDDSRFQDSCPRPFRGVVICATGVPEKTLLFKQAMELGATPVTALTDRVTHLVAIKPGSPKYICAVKRKIPIVSPEWILDSYEIWLKGGDVDLESSVIQHHLPTFKDVVVCFSGIADSVRRSQIMKLVTEQGGTFRKMERPVRVTHLLCSGDEETEKMRMATKFNSNGEANIHLVWESWFWDSYKFGGRWDENEYLVQNPRPEPKALPSAPSQFSEVGPSRSESLQAEPARPPPPPRLDVEDLEDEAATISIVPSVRLQVWGGLLERRGYEVADGELTRSPSKSQGRVASSSRDNFSLPVPARRAGGVIAAVRSTNSFGPVEKALGSTSQRALPFTRKASSKTVFARAGTPAAAEAVPPQRQPVDEAPAQENVAGPSSGNATAAQGGEEVLPPIFSGMRLCVLGEARTANVRDVVEKNGGTYVLEEDEPSIDFYIVRLVSGSKIFQNEPDSSMRAKYRTECWLESCVTDGRVYQLDEHPSYSPLDVSIPVPGAENVTVSWSGLSHIETLHLQRLLRAFGINLSQHFTRNLTHLYCPSGTGPKFDKAREWGIHVVSERWIAAIASTGTIPDVQDFLVDGPPEVVERQIRVDAKGKGKSVDRDGDLSVAVTSEKLRDTETGGGCDAQMNEDIIRAQQSPRRKPSQSPPDKQYAAPLSIERDAVEYDSPPGTAPEEPPVPSGLGRPTELLEGTSEPLFFADPHSAQSAENETPLIQYGSRASSSVAYSVGESFLGPQVQPYEGFPNTPRSRTQELRDEATPSRKGSMKSLRSRSSSLAAIEERDMMRVPSSMSPSPLKVPMRRVGSTSPTKFDAQKAMALQDSIASLLGKRDSLHEDSGEGSNANEMGSLPDVEGSEGRTSKRKRPQRAKAPARPKAQRSRTTTTAARLQPKSPGAHVPHASLGAFDPHDHGAVDQDSQRLDEEQQSLRVVYDDPAQKAEHNRLMSLLNNDSTGNMESGGGSVKRATRRSTRVSQS